MTVSIIIPVYKVAPYIEKCLTSVFTQSYKDIEVIIVDDHGNDGSMEIAHRVAAQFPSVSIRWIDCGVGVHAGVSAARNAGMCAAHNEYLYFIDSDDYLTSDCLASLVALAQKYHTRGATSPDLVVADYISLGRNLGYHVHLPEGTASCIWADNNAVRCNYFSYHFYSQVWNKLIRREFVMSNGLYFENGLIHEDNIWSFQAACLARSVVISRSITYHYVVHENSIMTSGTDIFHLQNYSASFHCMMQFLKDKAIRVDTLLYSFLESDKKNKMMQCFWGNMPEFGMEFYRSIRKTPYPRNAHLTLMQHLLELHRLLPEKYGLKYYMKFPIRW